MPPNALTGSQALALTYASVMSSPTATPHGLACFTITHAGRVEALHQPPRRLGVVQVEVAQLLAAVLHGVVPPTAPARRCDSAHPADAGSRRTAATAPWSSTGAVGRRAAARVVEPGGDLRRRTRRSGRTRRGPDAVSSRR